MKAQVVFIDYLQLLEDGKGQRPLSAGNASLSPARAGTDYRNISGSAGSAEPWCCPPGTPSAAALKESGQLEQDADAILLLSDDGEQYQAVLAKNKEGRVGEIGITFDKERQRFLEVDMRR